MKCKLTDDELVQLPKWVISLGARILLLAFVVPVSVAIVAFVVMLGLLNQNRNIRVSQEKNAERIEQVNDAIEDLPKKLPH